MLNIIIITCKADKVEEFLELLAEAECNEDFGAFDVKVENKDE